jgi:hypothetical protein
MATYTPLVHYAAEAAGDLPHPVIERHAREAVIAFCRRTFAWREQLTVTVHAGEFSVYPQGLPDQSIVLAIVDQHPSDPLLTYDPYLLKIVTRDRKPLSASVTFDVSFVTFDVSLALAPTVTSTTFPDFIYENWMDVLVAGTKGMMRPDIPQFMVEFEKGITRARIELNRQFSSSGLRATSSSAYRNVPYGGATRS